MTPAGDAAIENVLARSRSLGFLGPGSVRVHIEHALGFARGPVGTADRPVRRLLDLGSGGGVPGLVLARLWPEAEVVLLDAAERRTAFLAEAVESLGFDDRVRVVRSRAEAAGRDPQLRGAFDVVVARGFGPPAVTAECGAPLLVVGGRLLVSEPPVDVADLPSVAPDVVDRAGAVAGSVVPSSRSPAADAVGGPGGAPSAVTPDGAGRWPSAGLAALGLEVERTWMDPYRYQALLQREPCPERYPRRDGVPAKRPLF